MRKILLIEDDPDISDLIVYNLQKSGFRVHHVPNANEALILLENEIFDLILLDLMLPGLKGSDFLSIIRSRDLFTKIPVIIISAMNAEADIISGLNKGADDYLPKPFSMEMLATKVNTLLRRTVGGTSGIWEYRDIRMEDSVRKVFVGGREIVLTHREYELLKLFLSRPHEIFPRDVLLNSLWGYSCDFLTRTIDSHISTLRKKLGDAGSCIKSVPKVGYGIDD